MSVNQTLPTNINNMNIQIINQAEIYQLHFLIFLHSLTQVHIFLEHHQKIMQIILMI